MSDAHDDNAASGCLLCLVQASESMRLRAFDGLVPSPLDAAVLTIDRLLDALVELARAAGPPASRSLEIAVLSYKGDESGTLRMKTVLPGSSPSRPFVPLHALRRPGSDATGEETDAGLGPWVRVRASGSSPGLAALTQAARYAARWAQAHPGAASPVVVHLTDGESHDGPLDQAARF